MKIIRLLKNNENGSITVFVLASMLLLTMTLSATYIGISNKINSQINKIEKIKSEYSQYDINQEYNTALQKVNSET